MNTSNSTPDNTAKKRPERESVAEKQDSTPNKPKDDLAFGFEIRRTGRISRKKEETEQKGSSKTTLEQDISDKYYDHIEDFSTTMCYLIEYIHQASKKAQESLQTNFAEMYRVFINMILAAKKTTKKTTEEVVLCFEKANTNKMLDVVVPLVDRDDFRAVLQYFNAAKAAPRILAESMIQQIVNTWEHLLGSLIGTRTDLNALKHNHDVSVVFSELENLSGGCEIKQVFVNKIIREFLKNNVDAQLAAIKTNYKIDFPSVFKKDLLSDLKETIDRRHAIVHCNSIATSEYCDHVKQMGKTPPAVGEELVSSPQYLLHAWDVFFAAGIIVSNLFYISHARQMKSKKLEETAYSQLVSESHTALSQNRNEAARIILQYANKVTIHGEWPRLAAIINLALAHKRMGYSKECLDILKEHNWDYCDDSFKAAVTALRGNNKEALRLICKICRKDPEFVKSAHEWVVFEEVRQDDGFEKAMQALVSKRGKTMVKVAAPAVHFTKVTDDKVMLDKLYDIACKFHNQP